MVKKKMFCYKLGLRYRRGWVNLHETCLDYLEPYQGDFLQEFELTVKSNSARSMCASCGGILDKKLAAKERERVARIVRIMKKRRETHERYGI